MATYTLTFCDCGENHVGMQQIGEIASSGYSLDDLLSIRGSVSNETELIDLTELIDNTIPNVTPAYLLIIRKFIPDTKQIIEELGTIELDKQFFAPGTKYVKKRDQYKSDEFRVFPDGVVVENNVILGRIVNKRARLNVCFADEGQEPDLARGKGTIVAFDQLSTMDELRNELLELTNDQHSNECTTAKSVQLIAELNYYYKTGTCGIGLLLLSNILLKLAYTLKLNTILV
jgi:hypothetical protein